MKIIRKESGRYEASQKFGEGITRGEIMAWGDTPSEAITNCMIKLGLLPKKEFEQKSDDMDDDSDMREVDTSNYPSDMDYSLIN